MGMEYSQEYIWYTRVYTVFRALLTGIPGGFVAQLLSSDPSPQSSSESQRHVLRTHFLLSHRNSLGSQPWGSTREHTDLPATWLTFIFHTLNVLPIIIQSHEHYSEWRMASSGMLCRVAPVRTYVSEELSASFIRVTGIGELGTTLAVTSNKHMLWRIN
jgi:hypothetical protein